MCCIAFSMSERIGFYGYSAFTPGIIKCGIKKSEHVAITFATRLTNLNGI